MLQLRLDPLIHDLKKRLDQDPSGKRKKVKLTYITSRGLWYYYSWKGKIEQSGGIGTYIGIHFFDLLMWLFSNPDTVELHLRGDHRMGGSLELPRADVGWYLSPERQDVPREFDAQRTYRSITIDDAA